MNPNVTPEQYAINEKRNSEGHRFHKTLIEDMTSFSEVKVPITSGLEATLFETLFRFSEYADTSNAITKPLEVFEEAAQEYRTKIRDIVKEQRALTENAHKSEMEVAKEVVESSMCAIPAPVFFHFLRVLDDHLTNGLHCVEYMAVTQIRIEELEQEVAFLKDRELQSAGS